MSSRSPPPPRKPSFSILSTEINCEPIEPDASIQRSTNASMQTTIFVLMSSFALWCYLSYLDHEYTPRETSFILPEKITFAYQWCFVGYSCNWISTFLKIVFESNQTKLRLNLVVLYICSISVGSFYLLWTGYSPVLPNEGSNLYIPQRYLLYIATAPMMMYLLSQISNYSFPLQARLIVLHIVCVSAGGAGAMPWLSRPMKFLFYSISVAPYPEIMLHKWRMVTYGMNEADDPVTKRALNFMRVFAQATYHIFPILYFGSLLSLWPLEIVEPVQAFTDWFTKIIYTSSMLEVNFFAVLQRREAVRTAKEAKRIETINELNTAIVRKDDFLSTMSHELRTPLNGIIGLSESLLAGAVGPLPEKANLTIQTVKMSGKRLLQLINDVLDAAKMKQGSLVIKHEKVDLKRLVEDVVDITKPLINKKVQLINKVSSIPSITGDGDRITQILYNLIGNSSKFTRNGHITVSGGPCDDNAHVFIAVSDSGVGIPSDKFTQIFGAFEQVDMSTTRRYGGTGLGLHLVKQLVLAHNGDITVESEVGAGSTFTVIFPLTQSQEEATEDVKVPKLPPSSHTAFKPNKVKITTPTSSMSSKDKMFHHDLNESYLVLSVDDDPINQLVIENLLVPEGYKLEQAMGGTEALEFLAVNSTFPDLILLDVMMPDMSGYEVCEEIRKIYDTPVPIIMVSAKGSPEDIAKGLEMGANDYVKKPFHRQELLSRIRAIIRTNNMLKCARESNLMRSNESQSNKPK